MPRRVSKIVLVLFLSGIAGLSMADSLPTETAMEVDFDVSAGGELRVDVPDADIDIRPGSSGQVRIRVMIGGKNMEQVRRLYEKMNFRAAVDGGAVTLEADELRGLNWGSWGNFRIVAVIELPERFDVDVQTSDGDIRLESLDGDVSLTSSDGDILMGRVRAGSAKLHTSDGDIGIDELTATDLQLHTSDGDIVIDRLDVGEAELETSDGDIEIHGLRGALGARSGDGDIVVVIERFHETTLRSGDGDISVVLPQGAGADVELNGEEISLRTELVLDGKQSDGSARGRLNGGGPRLRATSGDGSISLGTR